MAPPADGGGADPAPHVGLRIAPEPDNGKGSSGSSGSGSWATDSDPASKEKVEQGSSPEGATGGRKPPI